MTGTDAPSHATCANCAAILTGPFCANCGQSARDLHRPLRSLLAEVFDDVFSLDARLVRTLRPLLVRPGQVTKAYLSGRRASHVPPLRTYLIAALVFFGLFTVFPTQSPPVYVFTTGSAEAAADASSASGSRLSIELPQHVWFGDRRFQNVSARALADPDAFALATYRNIPRAFVLFLPLFALLLKLFYRRQGYYFDHLTFSLYFHAFVFLDFSLLFLVGRATWLPDVVARPLWWALLAWPIAYLPMALRAVYGGSRLRTGAKTFGLGILYLVSFVLIGGPLVISLAVMTF